jgi:hypothetical protein
MYQNFGISMPTTVRFGDGVSAELPTVFPSGTKRVAVLRGARGVAAAPLVAGLREHGFAVIEVPCAGEPSVASVNAALDALAGEGIEAVVACGGGAVLDSGKAIAFCLGHSLRLSENFSDIPAPLLAGAAPIPCIAIPTTAGTGAEVTANAVLEIPSQQAKISLRGRALYPAVALVDPTLLPSAPTATILSSGLDAVVQTIEAYTSCAATPFSDALTAPNVLLGLRALRDVVETGQGAAWRGLAWVSLSSGMALANSGLGAAHGLASVLGGRYGTPHGVLCGRFLIPTLRQNTSVAAPGSEVGRRLEVCASAIAEVFPPAPGGDPLSGLEAWQDERGLARLSACGVLEADIDALAVQSAAASSSKKNGVVLGDADFATILRASL